MKGLFPSPRELTGVSYKSLWDEYNKRIERFRTLSR